MARAIVHRTPPDGRAIELVRRTIPVALKDAMAAAYEVARSDGVAEISETFEREKYFADDGRMLSLPQNTARYTRWKIRNQFDRRRGHLTGAVQRDLGNPVAVRRDSKAISGPVQPGKSALGNVEMIVFKYLQPLLNRIAHIKLYRENKAPIGQPSAKIRKRMAETAATAYMARMNTALEAGGFRERVRRTRGGEVVSR